MPRIKRQGEHTIAFDDIAVGRTDRWFSADTVAQSDRTGSSASLARWATALIGRQATQGESSLQKQGTEDVNKPQVQP